MELLDGLVAAPSAYARGLEALGLIVRNMHYLLNALRAFQVRPPQRYRSTVPRLCYAMLSSALLRHFATVTLFSAALPLHCATFVPCSLQRYWSTLQR